MSTPRVSTGITGLDEILKGGLKSASSYLLVGGPGTGKTILSLQILKDHARNNARCLYVTFAEPESTIRNNASEFGWDLSGITFVDLTERTDAMRADGEYSVFSPEEVEHESVWKRLYDALEKHKPEWLVIDSVTFLRYLATNDYQYHKHIQALVNHLREIGCLSLLLFEPSELEKENGLALAVDGVLFLRQELSRERVVEIRTLEVAKMRGSSFRSGRHPLRITSQGITIWPHWIEELKQHTGDRFKYSSGIDALDKLLMGGVTSGTCTLITGPAGAGKSSLTMQFLATAAANGIKGAVYTFEESARSIVERCTGISIPIAALIDDGVITLRELNPLAHYPDEFLQLIRSDIEEDGVQLLVLDSLRGYNLAMEQFGNLTANMQNIVNYIRCRRASLFLVNEQEKLTGDLRLTEHGVSYLTDNILLLRFAEYNGEIIKVIACMKKRLSDYQPELRELRITPDGLLVGDKLDTLRGLLGGVPTAVTSEKKPVP